MDFIIALLLLAINTQHFASAMIEHVCDTVDIRNFTNLYKLENCTVVTGNVIFAFPIIDEPNYDSDQINNISFPLREVTGFMFFHTITFLDSLGKLFPNLTLIRGQRLFSNYAVVLYETDLKEIAFRNLLKITRGSVRIGGSNHRLCMPKIDWDSIIMNGRLMIGNNVTRLNCTSKFDRCSSCERKDACWSNIACQRFDHTYFVEGSKTERCHPLCLGKCVNSSSTGCYVCRDISELGECVRSCSQFRYLNAESRRCITANECIALGRKMYKKDCVLHCPKGYVNRMNYTEMVPIDHFCIPCIDKCPRVCSNFPEIRTIAQLETVGSGCTIINGSLEINIMDDISNLTAELQIYLGDVEEIHGSLKIHRSTPLTSLTFLNKLRIVYGVNKQQNISSIRIFENQNLQSLFDWRAREFLKLEVKYGLVHIFNNPMLCESEIELFKNNLAYHEKRSKDLITRNGYQKKCRSDDIRTFSKVLSHEDVEILWEDLIQNQTNKVTGYLLQYVAIEESEIKEADENMLFERDSCSSHGWKSMILNQEDISIRKSQDYPNSTFVFKLSKLKQFTFYAFTIQRYNRNSFNALVYHNFTISGTSEVNIFQTFMNVPSRVVHFSVIIKSTNSITLKWEVSEKEKKAISRFLLYIYESSLITEHIEARDYCASPINFDEVSLIDIKSEENLQSFYTTDDAQCCEKCCLNSEQQEIKEIFKDDFKENLIEFSKSHMRLNPELKQRKMKNLPGFKRLISLDQYANNYTVVNLRAYTKYMFHLYTCAEKCSDYELLSERTAHDESFDSIEFNGIYQENSINGLSIHFNESMNINGAIVSYTIEIDKIVKNVKVPFRSECITKQQHEANGYEFKIDKIEVGSYIFRIRANSLAQHGPFIDWHPFTVTKPTKNSPIGLIVFSSSIFLALMVGISVSYYYKHKIRILLRNQNDLASLINEMEPTDFRGISLNHNSFDRLSDIVELEGE